MTTLTPAFDAVAGRNASSSSNADILDFLLRAPQAEPWRDNQADGFKAEEPDEFADCQADGYKGPAFGASPFR